MFHCQRNHGGPLLSFSSSMVMFSPTWITTLWLLGTSRAAWSMWARSHAGIGLGLNVAQGRPTLSYIAPTTRLNHRPAAKVDEPWVKISGVVGHKSRHRIILEWKTAITVHDQIRYRPTLQISPRKIKVYKDNGINVFAEMKQIHYRCEYSINVTRFETPRCRITFCL